MILAFISLLIHLLMSFQSATLMSGLKQKCQGDCWLERCCAGVLTA